MEALVILITEQEKQDFLNNIAGKGLISVKLGDKQAFIHKKNFVRVLLDNYNGSMGQLLLEAEELEKK